MRYRKRTLFCLCAVLCLLGGCGTIRETPVSVPGQTAVSDAGTISYTTLPTLCQYPELPTGCEATAAAMVLQFYGEEVSPAAVAGEWLSCDNSFLDVEGVVYGPDPNRVFVGDPFSPYAYGCFAPVIVEAVRHHSTVCTARTVTADTLESLCRTYADKGNPLLIWATMDMEPVRKGGQWKLEDGTDFVWPAGEHCLVLTGHTNHGYRFHDPRTGTAVIYASDICEARFRELGRQAVLITPL